MPAVTRKQYKGASAQTTITNALASGDTTITIAEQLVGVMVPPRIMW